MDPEISSFIFKFQNLCRAGKDAKLSFSSNKGRTTVNLNLELGSPPPLPGQHPLHVHPQKHRNGPSRERRRQKRADIRRKDAEQALASLSTEELEVLAIAEKAEQDAPRVGSIDNCEIQVNGSNEPNDEICSDSEYQTLNTAETDVEEIIVKPDCKTDWENVDVKDIIEYKLKIVGINVNEVETNRSTSGEIISCIVRIQPTPLNNLNIPSFPF